MRREEEAHLASEIVRSEALEYARLAEIGRKEYLANNVRGINLLDDAAKVRYATRARGIEKLLSDGLKPTERRLYRLIGEAQPRGPASLPYRLHGGGKFISFPKELKKE